MMSPTVTRTELENADDIIREVGVVHAHPRRGKAVGSPKAQCEGKICFESRTLAVTAAKRVSGRAAYRCQHCRQWHVGSVDKRAYTGGGR